MSVCLTETPEILSKLSESEAQEVYVYIDRCYASATHYDIAVLLHKVFKRDFRFIGKNRWEYYDNSENLWKQDDKMLHLKNAIKTHICGLFISRYLYWFNKSLDVRNADESFHYRYISDNMLRISYNLKSITFISTVIKEARGFFDIYNAD